MKSSLAFRTNAIAAGTMSNAATMGLVVAVCLSALGCAAVRAKTPSMAAASSPAESFPASAVARLPPPPPVTEEPFMDGSKVQSAATRLSVEDYTRANRSGLKTGGRSTGGGCSSGGCNGCGS